MTRNGSTVHTTVGMPMPAVPTIDPGPMIRMATDLALQANRMWMQLWFANMERASAAFWADVRRH